MKALVIGATGATGKALVSQLLEDDSFSEVHVFARKKMSQNHEKLHLHIVDFEKPKDWANLVLGDIAYSCMGTTLKQAGSKENQYQVDFKYQYQFAKIAKKNGVKTFVLLSAYLANSKSKIFYTRMKGELEDALKQLNFESTIILQPGILDRGESDRTGENLGLKLIQLLNSFGLFRKYKPMPVSVLAEKMIKLSKSNVAGLKTIAADEIFKV